MLRRWIISAVALSLAAATTGCIGGSDLLDTVDNGESESGDPSGVASAIIESLVSNPAAATSQPSKRDVIVRVADLLVTSTNPSATEQVAWDVVSSGLAGGKKGLRDSLMGLLFSPLADGFVGGLMSDD